MRLTLASQWLPLSAVAILAKHLQLRITRRLVCEVLVAVLAVSVGCPFAAAATEECGGNHILPAGNRDTDLHINGVSCVVDGSALTDGEKGVYVYRNVNIYNGGSLIFEDAPIDFHAHSILVEMNGSLVAGATAPLKGPLTIYLWGTKDDGIPSITCKSDATNQCGMPNPVWNSNTNLPMKSMPMPNEPCKKASDPDINYKLPVDDCFYQYDVLDAGDIAGAYFGRKVLAVSAGGNVILRGEKGIRHGGIEAAPADSGTSWAHLVKTLNGKKETRVYIDREVPTWSQGDHFVVTTTDYLPGHTEEFVVKSTGSDDIGHWIDIDTAQPAPMNAVQNPHWGDTYDYSSIVADHPEVGPVPDRNRSSLPPHHIETRAIVALLSRSITISSEGKDPVLSRTADHFPEVKDNFYGGHTLVRQGFASYQVQGVEFYRLGQGGALGRYPVHFHMDRSVPQPHSVTGFLGTFVADCSIVDSMTRFITVHATQGVTLARNVGYKSIGHGFYLEDATEVNNRLYSNVGISVRGALSDKSTNPRMVPGILDLPLADLNKIRFDRLADKDKPGYIPLKRLDQIPDEPPYVTDVTTPSVFWIMNTWNDFQYNVAVGAGVCGACYWMPPGAIGGPSRFETWTGYAGMEKKELGLAGATPVLNFKGNSCTAAMAAIVTVGSTNQCNGVRFGDGESSETQLVSILNHHSAALDQYPVEDQGQRAKTTVCDAEHQSDCSKVPPCTGSGPSEANCTAFVIDHFTTSFNWAPTNFAAIWLRGWWYLLDNSAITDVQNAGVTFISGGGYSRSDAAQGYWSVLKNSILVGNTQPIDPSTKLPENPFASNAGPFNPKGIKCKYDPNFCLSVEEGIAFVNSNFGVNQRLFNIYDGPASQYNNIYADVHVTDLGTVGQCRGEQTDLKGPGNCNYLTYMNGYVPGVLQYPPTGLRTNRCVLPNAAIAWKQPNGFYYPPAFSSDHLVFDKVDIRHFVIQPLYLPNSFNEDEPLITKTYCTWNPLMFKAAFTDIDRQTELTDDDGSLTGLTSQIRLNNPSKAPTISVTKDAFYNAPLRTDECASGQPAEAPTSNNNGATVDTSPYEYLTTAVVAECARIGVETCNGFWTPNDCASPACFGVPLYRQSLTGAEMTAYDANNSHRPSIRMMGQASAQRSVLTVNHANYYMDTTVPMAKQLAAGPHINVFQAGQAYDIFFIYGTENTKQSYSLYIGQNLPEAEAKATITPGRMRVPNNSFPFDEVSGGPWAKYGGYNADTGILTVNVDLAQTTDLSMASRKDFCQPTTDCEWKSNNTCGCKTVKDNTGVERCVNSHVDNKVCSYATKDIDCPVLGCYGFRITLPNANTFKPDPNGNVPPKPGSYASIPYFAGSNVAFDPATEHRAGNCFYSAPPAPAPTRNLLIPGSERLNPDEGPNQ